VAAAILGSAESNRRAVQDAYITLLGRRADPTGSATFTAMLDAGIADEIARASIAGSPEYFQRATGTREAGPADGVRLDTLHGCARGRRPSGTRSTRSGEWNKNRSAVSTLPLASRATRANDGKCSRQVSTRPEASPSTKAVSSCRATASSAPNT